MREVSSLHTWRKVWSGKWSQASRSDLWSAIYAKRMDRTLGVEIAAVWVQNCLCQRTRQHSGCSISTHTWAGTWQRGWWRVYTICGNKCDPSCTHNEGDRGSIWWWRRATEATRSNGYGTLQSLQSICPSVHGAVQGGWWWWWYHSSTAHQHQKGHTVPKQVIMIATSIQVATV